MVNDALKKFHTKNCPELPINSPELTNRLIVEIEKLKKLENGAKK